MNQESGKALLEAIRLHGLDNISLLAKCAGLHVETTRYMVWHELPSHGIMTEIELNFERMGLERWLLHLSFAGHVEAKTLFDFLKNEASAIYGSRLLPSGGILGLVLIPAYERHRLQRILDWLKLMNYIEDYDLRRLVWFRPNSLNPDYYDIREGAWRIDWDLIERVLSSKKKSPLPRMQNVSNTSGIDRQDFLLMRLLQIKLPSAFSKLAKSAGLDQFNARYHYNNHVKHYINGYHLSTVKHDRGGISFLFSYAHQEMSDLLEVRALVLSLPFTTAEWQTEDKRYGWSVTCPQEYINSTFRYISKHTSILKGKLKYEMLDDASEFKQTIPNEMFSEAWNRWTFEPKISLSLFHANFDMVRSCCEYYESGHCSYFEDSSKGHQCKLVTCAFARK